MLGLPDPRRVRRGLDAAGAWPRRLVRLRMAARHGPRIRVRDEWLTNTSGYRLWVRVTEPDDDRIRPAVILVPGAGRTGGAFDSGRYPVTGAELATAGVRAVAFDPVGRGKSWGHDDFCGSEGQDSLRAVIDYAHGSRSVDSDRLAVCTFSMGLSLAAPLLAREGDRQPIAFLLDWEGPPDRESILKCGPLPPAARAALARDPEVFWDHREPMRWMDDVPCGYLRLQGREDHMLGERGAAGAIALVSAAARGRAPWSQLNDNAPDVAWRVDQLDGLRWAPEGLLPLSSLFLTTITERLDPSR